MRPRTCWPWTMGARHGISLTAKGTGPLHQDQGCKATCGFHGTLELLQPALLDSISWSHRRCSNTRLAIDHADSPAVSDQSVVPMHTDTLSSHGGISSVPQHGMYVTAYAHALSPNSSHSLVGLVRLLWSTSLSPRNSITTR
jgi:hypothetical protein